MLGMVTSWLHGLHAGGTLACSSMMRATQFPLWLDPLPMNAGFRWSMVSQFARLLFVPRPHQLSNAVNQRGLLISG
jgi:hypothetical protein